MTYHAIYKDGGIFIPNIDKNKIKKNKIRLDIVLESNELKHDLILKTSGIISDKIDGIEWEKKMRSEWD